MRLPLLLAGAYATFYLPLGVQLPYLPLWLADRGLTPQEIGAAVAVPMVARLLATPVLGFLSDHWGRPKALLAALALITAVGMAVLSASRDVLIILLILGLTAMAWNPSFALLDSYAARLARAGRADYGRARQWGSGAFIVANLAGGAVIGLTGAWSVVLLMLAGQLAYLAVGLLLPELPRPPRQASIAPSAPRASRWLVAAVVGAALVQASHAVLYAFATVDWSARGFSLSVIGILWAIGVVAEMALFRSGTALVRRFGPGLLIAAGGLAAVVRFAALAFEPPLAALFALQLLHGLTFGATYLGMVELVSRAVSEHRAGAGQASAAWAVSLAMAAASLAAGPLWASFGAGAYLSSAALGLAGALLALAGRPQPQSAGSGGKASAPS